MPAVDWLGRLRPEQTNHIQILHQTLKSKGHQVYMVGGSVRDLAMDQLPSEIDLTTSATPEIVKKSFSHVIETGIQHGTVTVMLDKIPYEITTFRIDQGYTDGRRPDSVQFGTSLSEDLKRRDFTMNALALSLETGELIDEHNGQKDIQNKCIRCIGNPVERFSEDGLRPIRALRFASSLGFSIEPETREAIRLTKSKIKGISIERFWEELQKAYKGRSPSKFVSLLLEEDIFPLFFPDERPPFQPNPWVQFLDTIPKGELGFFLFVLLQALEVKRTDKHWSSFLQRLKVSLAQRKEALFFLNSFLSFPLIPAASPFAIRKHILYPIEHFARTNHKNQDTLVTLSRILFAHQPWASPLLQTESFWDSVCSELGRKPPVTLGDLNIRGNEIKAKFPEISGPRLGKLLQELLEFVWEYPEKNDIFELIQQSAYFLNNSTNNQEKYE